MAQYTRNVESSSMWWRPRPKQKSEDCSKMAKQHYPINYTSLIFFTQPPTPIKTYNSGAEGIFTATVRQKKVQGNGHAILLDEGRGKT